MTQRHFLKLTLSSNVTSFDLLETLIFLNFSPFDSFRTREAYRTSEKGQVNWQSPLEQYYTRNIKNESAEIEVWCWSHSRKHCDFTLISGTWVLSLGWSNLSVAARLIFFWVASPLPQQTVKLPYREKVPRYPLGPTVGRFPDTVIGMWGTSTFSLRNLIYLMLNLTIKQYIYLEIICIQS